VELVVVARLALLMLSPDKYFQQLLSGQAALR
jgi:hypothetical protein